MTDLPEYADNPLIRALGPIPAPADLVHALSQRPMFDPSERCLPPHVRLQAILRLQDFFVPLPAMIHAAQRLDVVLRRGYVGRNPATTDRVNLLQRLYTADLDITTYHADPQSALATFSLIGFSGMGKTSLMERALQRYPQVVFHNDLGLTQVVWLKINIPHDGSVKGLILGFFAALRTALRDRNVAREATKRLSVDELLPLMVQYAASYSVGVIVVDEMQNLTAKRSMGRDVLLNALEALANEVKAPEVLVGTMKARRLLRSDFRHARKSLSTGSFYWGPMTKGREWDTFLGELWPYQWTDEEAPLTPEMSAHLLDQTQGIVALVPLLFGLAQMRAIAYRKKAITLKILDDVMANELKALHPMLDALRTNDPRKIAQFEDIWPANLYDMLEDQQYRAEQKLARSSKKPTAPAITPSEQALNSLQGLNIDPEIAEPLIREVSEGEVLTARQISTRVLAKLAAVEKEQSMPEDDLRRQLAGEGAGVSPGLGADPLQLGTG